MALEGLFFGVPFRYAAREIRKSDRIATLLAGIKDGRENVSVHFDDPPLLGASDSRLFEDAVKSFWFKGLPRVR